MISPGNSFSRAFLALVLASGSLAAGAQEFPNKVVKIVIPFPAGALLDTVGLALANKFRAKWGQPVILEHRPGAAGNIGAEATFKAPPDGHTLILTPPGPLVTSKLLYEKLAYDPEKLTPISLVVTNANVLVVHPKVPARTLQEFIEYAKKNPSKLNYATAGAGSTQHLSAELFESLAGVKMVHVPYKGVAPAQNDLIGGHVDLMFAQFSNVVGAIRAGNLRLIAVGSAKRSPHFPDAPAINEVLPGFVSSTWMALAGPPGMSPRVTERISVATQEAMRDPEVARMLQELTFEPVGSPPAELVQLMRQEGERWGAVIRATGTKAE